ncbi:MAG: PIG-L family deacetylase [Syntrophomonadaceae bacterium]|nr:PIG-L family deacetylase [Syntrophomonadaceae bacterium]
MEKVMVFAPHPDDDMIGCGGSMAHHVRQGDQVSIVYMTSGEAGSIDCQPGVLAACREDEAMRAAAGLQIEDLIFLRYPDGGLEFTPKHLDALVSIIRTRQPDRIYLPHSGDSVSDHEATHRLVMEAIRRAAGPWHPQCGPAPWRVATILGYEVWTPLGTIGSVQDISPYISLKLQALQAHRSQLRSLPYDQAIAGLNRYRGIMTGQGDYCECFQLIRARL